MDVESDIDLYDHDRITINNVVTTLRSKIGSHQNLEGFRKEIINRFGESGFATDVRVFADDKGPEPVYYFKVIIMDRVEPEEVGTFDHERQGHEVRANILGVDQPDVGNKLSVSVPSSGLWTPGN